MHVHACGCAAPNRPEQGRVPRSVLDVCSHRGTSVALRRPSVCRNGGHAPRPITPTTHASTVTYRTRCRPPSRPSTLFSRLSLVSVQRPVCTPAKSYPAPGPVAPVRALARWSTGPRSCPPHALVQAPSRVPRLAPVPTFPNLKRERRLPPGAQHTHA